MISSENFDLEKPTAFVLGRFQPVHEGHLGVIQTAAVEVGQVCIAVRNTPRGPDNPFDFGQVCQMFMDSHALTDLTYCIILVPNITSLMWGRRPGFGMKRVELPPELEAISATALREKARAG